MQRFRVSASQAVRYWEKRLGTILSCARFIGIRSGTKSPSWTGGGQSLSLRPEDLMQRPPVGQTDPSRSTAAPDLLAADGNSARCNGWLRSQGLPLAGVVLVFIATRLWLLLAFQARYADTSLFFVNYALQGVDAKMVVYRDFKFEFPPLAWWLMAAPRWLDSQTKLAENATPEMIAEFLRSYLWWFHAEILVADMACLGLMFLVGRQILPKFQWVLPGLYTLLTIAQPHVTYDRLDVPLLMFFLLTIYCWLRSLDESDASESWAIASYFWLGFGISCKLMPLVFVPFLLLADLWWTRSFWRLAARVGALAISGVGPFLIYAPAAGRGILWPYTYHSERGTHLESVWGSIMLVGSKFGVPCKTVYTHRACDLVGDWSSGLKTVANVTMLALPAFYGLWALLRGRQYDRRQALDAAQLALVNSTVFAHVYSPQYLAWLVPVALILALNVLRPRLPVWLLLGILVTAIVGISSWLFPDLYEDFMDLSPLPVALAVTRSVCLVILALLLNISFLMKYGLLPARIATALPARAT